MGHQISVGFTREWAKRLSAVVAEDIWNIEDRTVESHQRNEVGKCWTTSFRSFSWHWGLFCSTIINRNKTKPLQFCAVCGHHISERNLVTMYKSWNTCNESELDSNQRFRIRWMIGQGSAEYDSHFESLGRAWVSKMSKTLPNFYTIWEFDLFLNERFRRNCKIQL